MKDIVKLEELPKRLGMFRSLSSVDRNWSWGHGSNDYHKVNGYYPYTHAMRIIKHYMGKSFNDAFTHFCKIVPKYQQHHFFERFRSKTYRSGRHIEYYVDENGNIQSHKNLNEYQGPYIIFSNDYEIGFRLKTKTVNNKKIYYGELITLEQYNKLYNFEKELYEKEILSGYKIECKSQNDPRYLKYKSEKRKRKNKLKREQNKINSQKIYSFLTKSELEKKASKEKDIITRDRFGFDDDSFKGEAYHGQKRKKRKNDNNTETLQSLFEIM